jgi:predicted transcriptional regulator
MVVLSGQGNGFHIAAEGLPTSALHLWLAGVANPVKLAVLQALADTGSATVGEIAQLCEASTPTIRRHLDAMVTSGIILEEVGASDGLTTGRPATTYSLPASISTSVRLVFASIFETRAG